MNGFLNVKKPTGRTSSDLVVFVRKRLPKGTAVGHGGTLDPEASGVLPVCVGSATRLFDYIIDKRKSYVARIKLGVETDTQDATGDPLPFVPRTALAIDVSEDARLGEAGLKLFGACEHRAALDHHHTNPGFGQIYALDGYAAAAGELVVDLIEALGVALTRDMGSCLFVAISTDCGHFNYSNTREQTFRAAAEEAFELILGAEKQVQGT